MTPLCVLEQSNRITSNYYLELDELIQFYWLEVKVTLTLCYQIVADTCEYNM